MTSGSSSPEREVESAKPYRKLAQELGVAGRIDWRLRFVADPEIPDLLEEAAVVVLPYRKIESSGVLATALGHGRPVVVTDVGSLGDTVREFHAGSSRTRTTPAPSPLPASRCCARTRSPTPSGGPRRRAQS